MHSTIFQLSTERLSEDEWINENTFIEDYGRFGIDYTNEGIDREEEIESLADILPKSVFKVEGDKVTILNNGECLFEQYKRDLQQILDEMTYNKGTSSALASGAYRLSKRALRIIDCNTLFHIPEWNWLGTSNDLLEYANYAFEKRKPKTLYICGILDYHY